MGIDLLPEGTLEPRIGSGFATRLILVGPVSTHGLNTRMAEPGSCSMDRQSPPMAQCHLHPAPNGAVDCPQRCVKVFILPTLCPGGGKVCPVGRVWCFSSVKQITLVVAARGCYSSHSAVELGRINEHHPQSPALTAGKSFLGSQPTLWSLLLEDPRPGDARTPHLDLADSCSQNSCKWRLKCY